MASFFDLSQYIQPGMTFFPGDPEPVLQTADGATAPWRVTQLNMGSHTGTHIDAAAHYFREGKSIDQYELRRFVLPGMVIPVVNLEEDQPVVVEQIIHGVKNFPEGGALLIQTEWDQHWMTEKYLRHPYLSLEAAVFILQTGAGLVGIDALNVDSTVQSTDHIHRTLLESDVLIVENLRGLNQLQPGRIYQFSFLPLRLTGIDGSPIRAVAWEPQLI